MEDLRLHSLALTNPRGEVSALFDADEPIHAELRYRIIHPIRGARMILSLYTTEGDLAFVCTDHQLHESVVQPGDYCSRFVIPGKLLNRRAYSACPTADAPGHRHLITTGPHVPFTVGGNANHLSGFPERWPGVVCPSVAATLEKTA